MLFKTVLCHHKTLFRSTLIFDYVCNSITHALREVFAVFLTDFTHPGAFQQLFHRFPCFNDYFQCSILTRRERLKSPLYLRRKNFRIRSGCFFMKNRPPWDSIISAFRLSCSIIEAYLNYLYSAQLITLRVHTFNSYRSKKNICFKRR